ncbi:MAG: histidine--tRNA ligase [Gammaproteobacteria bacterium]|nr:histidine--tRNA ligase [Gammaproteobacteria bacterium]MDD9863803.1 histidine--tRNA ligase [Gammaproteobacteria bacterium]
MTARIQAVRGMRTVPPDQSAGWRAMEQAITDVFARYGYREIRFPIVDRTETFQRSIGELTDIVSKEMYSFRDRGGNDLTLRPEGTAGCVRAAVENGLLTQARKLWYAGPMFRYERPQKGRHRQFRQAGVEVYGMAGAAIEVEMLAMGARIWSALGLPGIVLELNMLGSPQSREEYRRRLGEYFRPHQNLLNEEEARRLRDNPLRLMDSKDPKLRELTRAAPDLRDCLDAPSRDRLCQVCALLEELGLAHRVNPRLVRGLDYYSGLVFEWLAPGLGAQDAICAGGRYDELAARFGGPQTPAIGFAIGLDRIQALLQDQGAPAGGGLPRHAYLLLADETAVAPGLRLAESLRDRLPWLQLTTHCAGGSLKSQFRKADKSGARFALVLAEREVAARAVTVKPLRGEGPQQTLRWEELPEFLDRQCAQGAQ